MKPRKLLLTAHLIVGAVVAPILIVLGVTGAILAVQPELEDAVNVELTHVTPQGTPLSLAQLVSRLQPQYPGTRLVSARLPERPDRAVRLGLATDTGGVGLFVDPYRGVVLGNVSDVWELRPVHDLHTKLLIESFGSEITGWTAAALLFLTITGLMLWWPGKILRLVREGPPRRFLFHLHSALAAWSWLGLILLSLTAVVLHWQDGSLALVSSLTNAAPIPGPPDPGPGCSSDNQVSFDQLLVTALAAAPGAEPTTIRGATDPGEAVGVQLRFPGDRTPAGRTFVYLDPCTGAVRSALLSPEAPVAYRLVRQWNREVHTGDIFGWPTRALMFLTALLLPIVAVSGPLLWWVRRKKSV